MRIRQWLCGVAAASAIISALPAAEPGTTEVKLACEPMQNPIFFTPRHANGQDARFAVSSRSGEIAIGGAKVMVSAAVSGETQMMGVDLNGDGKVDPREMVKLSQMAKQRNAPFLAAVAAAGGQGAPRVLVFSGVSMYATSAGVTSFHGNYASGTVYKGNLNGTTIRLYDDNLDGKITQDGKDAVFIGQSECAQPLGRFHQIGNCLYEVKVSGNADSATFTKEADAPVGQVRCQLQTLPALKALVLTSSSDGRSYDLTSTKALPAGDYRLSYGVLNMGKDTVTVTPSPASPTYAIKANTANAIRLGQPFRVEFTSTFNQATGEVTVAPYLKIMGTGNEVYNLGDTAGFSQPSVAIQSGDRILAKNSMEYG